MIRWRNVALLLAVALAVGALMGLVDLPVELSLVAGVAVGMLITWFYPIVVRR